MRKPQIALVADPQEHEGYLIKELYHLLRARIEARMRTAGIPLSFPHAQVLHELTHEPGLSSAQLARRCGVTPQTMIGLVAALEQQGIIERRVHPENARVMQCYVRTDRLENLERARSIADGVIEQMLAALPSAERDQFKATLRRCIGAVEQIPIDAAEAEGQRAEA